MPRFSLMASQELALAASSLVGPTWSLVAIAEVTAPGHQDLEHT